MVKYFTWQKVKYVWSGVAKYKNNMGVIGSVKNLSFQRQIGFVAPDDVDPKDLKNQCMIKHQIIGTVPLLSTIRQSSGLTSTEAQLRTGLLGRNAMELPLTPLFVVFLREILTPFYIFQLFSVSVWLADGYTVYAVIIIILSAISMIWEMVSIRMGEVALRKTMHKSSPVEVVRPGSLKTEMLDPGDLVPGDVLLIPNQNGYTLQCDAAILNGTCLVDEAMLTGESVPVLKFALPPVQIGTPDDEMLQIRKHERSILFCGTKVLQTHGSDSDHGDKIKVVVIRTGFMTAKGELTRLILYPKPLDFQFAVDAAKFVGVMALIASIGLVYSIILRITRNEAWQVVITRSLDIITIAVPPALPIALTIGYMMAQRRLKKRSVYCTSPSAINVAGLIDVVCMDKTGTMTEGGLDFETLLPVEGSKFTQDEHPATLHDGHLLRCLVSCHSLALVDGKAIGDPMEEKMFELAGWHLTHGEVGKTFAVGSSQPKSTIETFSPISIIKPPTVNAFRAPYIGVLRQLPFSSDHARMSVVACPISVLNSPENEHQNEGMHLYLKGAPERVMNICRKETIPNDISSQLSSLTEHGYRVLGLAHKDLERSMVSDILSADRDELESDLTFLGLLVFENKLKPETCGIINKLKKAGLRTMMLTGDNPLTATSVATQAGLISEHDKVIVVNGEAPTANNPMAELKFVEMKRYKSDGKHTDLRNVHFLEPAMDVENAADASKKGKKKLVITGASWAVVKEHFPEEIDKILLKAAVFARVNPNQKKEVIEGLQRLELYALMCGDGANDCGALRAAFTGISLSQAEASVASPFTSQIENISCIHLLIREGRCALVTSFAIFRFMVLYALIQFVSVCILYTCGLNLTQYQFLYSDLILATTLVFTMSFTEAYGHLVAGKPPESLLERKLLFSIFLQSFLVFIFQLIPFLYLYFGNHFWFLPFKSEKGNDGSEEEFYRATFENYPVFVVSTFQYCSVSFVLSKVSTLVFINIYPKILIRTQHNFTRVW